MWICMQHAQHVARQAGEAAAGQRVVEEKEAAYQLDNT
jgi:hypothetical protein